MLRLFRFLFRSQRSLSFHLLFFFIFLCLNTSYALFSCIDGQQGAFSPRSLPHCDVMIFVLFIFFHCFLEFRVFPTAESEAKFHNHRPACDIRFPENTRIAAAPWTLSSPSSYDGVRAVRAAGL